MSDESIIFIMGITFVIVTISAAIMLYFIWHFSIFLFIIILTISFILGFITKKYQIDDEVGVFLIVLIIMTFSVFFYYMDEIFKDEETGVKAVVQTLRQKYLSTSKETTQTQKIDLKSAPIKVRKSLQGYPCDNDLLAEYRKIMGDNDATDEFNKTVDDIAVEKEKR